jgi:GTP-binding protein HflX
VWLSAVTGEGIPLLLEAIGKRLGKKKVHGVIRLEASQGRQRALLFDMGAVLQEKPVDDGGWVLELEMPERDFHRFIKRENLPLDILEKAQANEPAASIL